METKYPSYHKAMERRLYVNTKISVAIVKFHTLHGMMNDMDLNVINVAKHPRQCCLEVKAGQKDKDIEMTHEWAYDMVLNTLFNF